MTTQGIARPGRRIGARRMAVGVALVLLVLAASAALFMVRTVDSHLAEITATYELRRQARDTLVAVLDAETGQRGYLLTGKVSYLQPYQDALNTLEATYARLVEMARPKPQHAERVAELRADLDLKIEELRRTVELAGQGNSAEAIAIVDTDTGRQTMDRIRTTLTAMIAEEDAHLLERSSEMAVYRQSLVAAIIAALGASAVLAWMLFTRTQAQVQTLAQRQSALVSQNEELEVHVRQRTVEVEEARSHAERERARLESLLQETNHRIGNSLATVSSLLGLQLTRSKSDEVKAALEAAQARVHAIASGHRRLRLGADLETTNAAEFLDSVVDDLATTATGDRQVAFRKEFAEFVIPARDATTIGIILGELVTNAMKHAFAAGQAGTIWVQLRMDAEGRPVLAVADDGQGMRDGDSAHAATGLGAVIIRQLARQFGGEPDYRPREGGGTVVTVPLPKLVPERN